MLLYMVSVRFSIDGSRPLSWTSVVNALALFHHWLPHRPVLSLYHVFWRTSKAVCACERYSAEVVLVVEVDLDFKEFAACGFKGRNDDDDCAG